MDNINNNIISFIAKNEKKLLIIIIFIGFLLRIYAVFVGYGANHFSKIDEFEAYKFGMNFYYFSNARLFGAYLPGPLQNLFVFLLIKLTKTVYSMYIFFVLIGTWTIFLIYKFIYDMLFLELKEKQFIVSLTAISSALFFAVMPWPVKFSISFWNPHFVIPLITIFLGNFYKFVITGDNKSYLKWFIPLILIPFFHMIIIYAIIPLLILSLIFYFRKLKIQKINKFINETKVAPFNKKLFLYSLIYIFLIYIPFIYFDFKNNFFILSHYINGGKSFYRFRPETFKIISNIIIVMTDEISRFTGHKFIQYKFYLDRAYGYFIFGFIFILPSFLIVLIAYIRFFKKFFFNEKRYILNLFIAIYIGGAGILHILSGMPHELRYTILFFPLLILIVNLNTIEIIIKKYFEKRKIINFVSSIFIFTLIVGLYTNLSHYYQESKPNYKNKVRLIPSLIFYEDVKKSILRFENANFSYINNFNLKNVEMKKSYSIYYFFPVLQNSNNLKIKNYYFLSSIEIFKKWDSKRQVQILNLLKDYLNSNLTEKKFFIKFSRKIDYIIFFIDKDIYKNNKYRILNIFLEFFLSNISKNEDRKKIVNKFKNFYFNYKIIGEFSNCYYFIVKNILKDFLY